MAVKDLQHSVRQLDNFEIPRIIGEHKQAWYAEGIAVALWIIAERGRNRSGSIRRLVRIELRFTPRRSWWRLLAHRKDSVPSRPDSRKVGRFKWKRSRRTCCFLRSGSSLAT